VGKGTNRNYKSERIKLVFTVPQQNLKIGEKVLTVTNPFVMRVVLDIIVLQGRRKNKNTKKPNNIIIITIHSGSRSIR
jgi:ABC-type sulfate transport system permease subunit